jgi:4-amino-4-deoxy-L-arabinose transferase-like glycosyltransferase
MFLIGRRLFGPWQGFSAAVLLNLAPVFSLSTGIFYQPEGPLMFFWLATIWYLIPLLLEESPAHPLRVWTLAGAMLGLAFLSKYSALFLVLGAGLYLLTHRERRHWLASSGPYLAAVVALLCFTPVLLWNAEHQWISLLWQGHRGADYRGLHLNWMVYNLGGQALEVLPWLWIPLVIEPFRAIRGLTEERAARRFLLYFGLPPILAFTAVSAYARIGNHFHWGTPGYLVLLIGLGATVYRWMATGGAVRRAAIVGVGVLSIGFMVITNVQAVTGRFTAGYGPLSRWLAAGNDATVELIDFTALEQAFRQHGFLDRKDLFVFSDRWYLGGKVDYALKGQLPFLLLNTSDPREYAFFDSSERWIGKEGILVSRRKEPREVGQDYAEYCSAIEPLPPVEIARRGRVEDTLYLYRCASLVQPFPTPYR